VEVSYGPRLTDLECCTMERWNTVVFQHSIEYSGSDRLRKTPEGLKPEAGVGLLKPLAFLRLSLL
jgi:hypothetical protein